MVAGAMFCAIYDSSHYLDTDCFFKTTLKFWL